MHFSTRTPSHFPRVKPDLHSQPRSLPHAIPHPRARPRLLRGKGRSPWCTEPGAVILISDGKHATAGVSNSGVPIGIDMDALTEGARGAVGAELCGKPFRWDQRLFSLILGGRAEGGRGEGGGGLVGGGGGIGYALSATETVLKVRGE